MLALHEEYGEEKDQKKKLAIFHELVNMDEKTYYQNKKIAGRGSNTDSSELRNRISNSKKIKMFNNESKPYGPNVGKEGGNP